MLQYRTGVAGSAAGGKDMAEYLLSESLTLDTKEELARYYAGEVEPVTELDRLARAVAAGELLFSEALAGLTQDALRLNGFDADIDQLERRLGDALSDAAFRAEVRQDMADEGGTVAEVRADISPRMAERLGIDRHRPPTQGEIAQLLSGLRADGEAIEGKQVHAPRRSIADVFGLDSRSVPTAEVLANVLAGRRADGAVPTDDKGVALPDKVIAGARKRFLVALGVPSDRDASPDEMAQLQGGKMASGVGINLPDYTRAIHATNPPVGYIDLVWSADKSLSVAWALAPTDAERTVLLRVHTDAVASAMAYVEQRLGFARMGKDGRGGEEPGSLAWLNFAHYTSRPTAEVAQTDAAGVAYTAMTQVPALRQSDPQLHTHAILLNAVLTESGRMGAIDRDKMDGLVKEFGAVYQAFVARNARRHGIEVALGPNGEARVAAVPSSVRDHFSKRSQNAERAAREYAAEKGQDWDALTPQQKISLMKRGVEETRERKREGPSDFAAWREQAAAELSYSHRSVLRPDDIQPALTTEQRHQRAYEASLPLIEDAFARRAKLDAQDVREIAARGLVVGGIENPAADIAAVGAAYRAHGVRHDGQQVELLYGRDQPMRGKERWSVTTALHEMQEKELVRLARTAGADKSAALSPAQVNRAVDAFLERRPEIDQDGAQWKAQHAMMLQLATGGRLGVAIGAAGAGKSTVLAPLVDAWKADGRHVYGATVAHRQANELGGAGIAREDRTALAAFLRRAEIGKYALGRNSVVVIDEVGLVGTRQMLDLLKLQEKHGFQLVQIGDDKQCQSIEAGPVIDLLREAVGKQAVPEILTSVRQKTEREQTIAGLFRDGKAADALALKREDRTAELVAGGRVATVARVAKLWRERTEATQDDPRLRLTISAPTNQDARDIGLAIRGELRAMGKLGDDRVIVNATDRSGDPYDLPLAAGDRVRVFDRVYAGRWEALASNGDVLEVRNATVQGMQVRNATGKEAFITWDKMSESGGPVRLAPGYAATIDTSQGSTSDEHINALVSGSRAVHGFKNYVAASRHTTTNWLVVNEAEERKQLAARVPHGAPLQIREPDVWANVATNLSRQPMKASATDFLRNTIGIKRGTVSQRYRGMEPHERQMEHGRRMQMTDDLEQKQALVKAPVREQVQEMRQRAMEQAQALQPKQQQQKTQRRERVQEREYRGPTLSM